MQTIVSISGCMAISFFEPTLTLHLQKAAHNSLNSAQIGLYFIISVGSYTICSPIVGYLTDNKLDGRYTIITGYFIASIALFFMGPSPLISSFVKLDLRVLSISLAIFGIGMSPYLIPDLAEMSLAASNAGLSDGLAVKGILSGIFQSCLSIGSGLGPTLGGFLTDKLSFEWASTIFSFVVLIEAIVLMVFTIWERKSKWHKRIADTTPLISDCNNRKYESRLL